MISLRPYQADGIARVDAELQAGRKRIVIQLPTGGGKTVIAVAIILAWVAAGKRVLFCAHRRELINQTVRKLIEAGLPEDQIGVIMGDDKRYRPQAPVQVASIDTLRNRAKPHADLVFIDECHRTLSKSYVSLCEHYENATILGLTATPWRLDGKGLDDIFEALVSIASPRILIDEGFLVAPRVWSGRPAGLPDLDGVKTVAGDYEEGELERRCNQPKIIGQIVEHWQQRANNARTVAFAVNVAHSLSIAERFREAGIPAEHLDGTTPMHVRDAILARLASGETRVVSNYGVLCEGWDQPPVKCAILARPTESLTLYLQQAGRILRPWEGETALILDHARNALRHGLPQNDRDWSLDGRTKNQCPTKTCPDCYLVVDSHETQCPQCGYVWPVESQPGGVARATEGDGELIELTSAAIQDQIQSAALRRQIQAFAYRSDRARHWTEGTTNKALWKVFRKSRTKMTTAELRRVLEYFVSGDFDRAHPLPTRDASVPPLARPVRVEPKPPAQPAKVLPFKRPNPQGWRMSI